MNILVEGPNWMGMWTENVTSALESMGHHVRCHHHNLLPWPWRAREKVAKLGRQLGFNVPSKSTVLSNIRLLEYLRTEKWDLLLSIQGKIDAQTILAIRHMQPHIRIAYWWGDPLSDPTIEKLTNLHIHIDVLALAAHGNAERLAAQGLDKLMVMPFAASWEHHFDLKMTPEECRRFTSDVSIVATARPDRCRLVQYLNAHLDSPVRVWGRSWRRCKGVPSHGRLSLEECLKVYACSKLSLNLYGDLTTENGYNMRHYEIAAAGGFQITEAKPLLDNDAHKARVATFTNREDLLQKIRYYLENDSERQELAIASKRAILEHDLYQHRMEELLARLFQGQPAPTSVFS